MVYLSAISMAKKEFDSPKFIVSHEMYSNPLPNVDDFKIAIIQRFLLKFKPFYGIVRDQHHIKNELLFKMMCRKGVNSTIVAV